MSEWTGRGTGDDAGQPVDACPGAPGATHRGPGDRVFRILMRAYPRSFRHAFGAELRAFFEEDRRRAMDGPAWSRPLRWLRFWLGTVVDVVGTGCRLQWRVRAAGRGGVTMGWMGDVRHMLRGLRKDPGYLAAGLITIVLATGSASAMFSVVDGVVLRPLPYQDADRLVMVGSYFEDRPAEPGAVSVGDFRALRERAVTLDRVAYSGQSSDVLVGDADPEAVDVGIVSEEFFRLFGGRAVVGRSLTPEDHAAGATPVVVLRHAFWVRRFGADPGVVGRTLTLERNPATIVGVLDEAFDPPARIRGADAVAWRPLRVDEDDNWYSLGSHVLARIAPGEAEATVGSELERLGPAISDAFHPEFPYGYRAQNLQRRIVGSFPETGRALMLAAGLLLLIGCANLANLTLTRRVDREHEMAVRVALGAGRARVARLVVLEAITLALCGGAVGLVFASGAIETLKAVAPGGIPRLDDVVVDLRIAAFAASVSGITALLAGLAPGLRRVEPADSLGGQARGGTGREVVRFRRAMVVAETALALVLLTSAGLLVRSVQELGAQDTGLELDALAALRVDVRRTMSAEEQGAFFRTLEERVAALPGVEGASWISVLPFTSDGMMNRMTFERTTGGGDIEDFLPLTSVSPSFFETAAIEPLEGRALEPSDTEGAPLVAVANEAFVSTYLADEPRVSGLRFWYGDRDDGDPVTLVGVVENMAYRLDSGPLPQLFVPVMQSPWGRSSLVVRSPLDPAGAVAAARAEARALEPTLPVDVTTLETLYRDQLARPRFYALLAGGFAALAGLLALVGMYGTVAYAVRRRTRELGIRLALGARSSTLVAAVVGRGARDAAWGIALGLAGSLAATRLVESYLFGVETTDARAFAGAAGLLLVASIAAAWLPARRAARVDAHESLTMEA